MPLERTLLVMFAAGAISLGLAASPSQATMTPAMPGSISGSLGNTKEGPWIGTDELTAKTRIVVKTAGGVVVGILHYATPNPATSGPPSVAYTIDHLPLGVPLTVAADHALAGLPSPVPSGFFHMFQIQRAHYDYTGSPSYAITLTADAPKATGIDFVAEPIEVFPALQPPPTPAGTSRASATASPGP